MNEKEAIPAGSGAHSPKHFSRIPQHIGIIPDGNRRWAAAKGMGKEKGYQSGLDPGLQLFRLLRQLGVKEVTCYGFTTDNTKRPSVQTDAFTAACINAVEILQHEDASLLVLGNTASDMFPRELLPYTARTDFGRADIRVNFLVNYGWEWDIFSSNAAKAANPKSKLIRSSDISRIDLIIRWGGRRRLSGFLPVQCAYADFFIIDDLWPDYTSTHVYQAMEWYQEQDITLGG
jgi:undecaprenyl diphosphate synthase